MEFYADDSNVNVIGRSLMMNNTRYLGYSCSAIEFEFTGTKVEADIWTDSDTLETELKAWVAVFVNDEELPVKRFSLEKNGIYLLYEGAKPQTTKIRLVKYSEAAFGKIGIRSIRIDSDQPPRPTKKKSRRIEFIGNSITCGYGNEGIWNVDTFQTSQENPWEAYAALTARKLEADYQLVCWSGIGIISNYTEQEVPNTTEWLMPQLYPYTDRATDQVLGNTEPEVWKNERFDPDCIVINLGTNDSSYTKNINERVEAFGNRYYEFVREVRNKNPRSKILCTLGAMGQDLCEAIRQQVERMNSEGDDNVHFMDFDVQREEDGIGTDWHPSKATHRKMAVKLTDKLKTIMNW